MLSSLVNIINLKLRTINNVEKVRSDLNNAFILIANVRTSYDNDSVWNSILKIEMDLRDVINEVNLDLNSRHSILEEFIETYDGTEEEIS